MKRKHLISLFLVVVSIIESSTAHDLEYNFQIKDGKNTLLMKTKEKKKQSTSKLAKKISHHKTTKKKSKGHSKTLKRMIKLGTLIDRITDRLSQNKASATNANNSSSSSLKSSQKNVKGRKAMGMGGALAIGGGAAAAGLAAGAMAGAADNQKLEVEIDKLKMQDTVENIGVTIQEEMNDLLNKSSRGFSTMKVRVSTITANMEQKISIAEDNVQEVLGMLDSIYDNGQRAVDMAKGGDGGERKQK
jgi:hypothetical protein